MDWDWEDGPPRDAPPRERGPEEPLRQADSEPPQPEPLEAEPGPGEFSVPDELPEWPTTVLPPAEAPGNPPGTAADLDDPRGRSMEAVQPAAAGPRERRAAGPDEPGAPGGPRVSDARVAARERRRRQVRRRRLVALVILIAAVALIVVLVVRGCGGSDTTAVTVVSVSLCLPPLARWP